MALARYEHKGAAPATGLAAPMGVADTTFTVNSGTGYPTGAIGPFWIVLDPGTAQEEKVLCSSRSGTTFTVAARNADDTSASPHAAGTMNVQHVWTAAEADDTSGHIYTPGRDDHTQYSRTDGTRAITGNQTFSSGLTSNNGLTVTAGGLTVAAGTTAVAAATATTVTATGEVKSPDYHSTGLNGVTSDARFVGSMAEGPPTSTLGPNWVVGDLAVDRTGTLWVCTNTGNPGAWLCVSGALATGNGPALNTQVVNTTTDVVTIANVTVQSGGQYRVDASGFFTIITSSPAFVNMKLHDSQNLISPQQYLCSFNSDSYAVGDVRAGSCSTTFTAGSTIATNISISAQSSGAGAGIQFSTANACNIIVTRIG